MARLSIMIYTHFKFIDLLLFELSCTEAATQGFVNKHKDILQERDCFI